MNHRLIVTAVALLLAAAPGAPAQEKSEQPRPGPYVDVYRDDATVFQVRRDRIKLHGDGLYNVWLRWLWAEPMAYKSDVETARVIVADLDCTQLRVRELAVLHKNRSGQIFAVEETTNPEEAPWKSFQPNTGAAKAIGRLCEFVPELLQRKEKGE